MCSTHRGQQAGGILGEFLALDCLQRAGDHAARIGDRDADGFGAQIKPHQSVARIKRGNQLGQREVDGRLVFFLAGHAPGVFLSGVAILVSASSMKPGVG